jgi:RNA polymerase sigma-70 factor (ECF subfamily)
MSTDPPGGRQEDGPPDGSPDEPDDRTLLQAHLDGDPDAFGRLFTRHRDRLWAVALRTTGDREEAADALQDALIAAFRRAESYRGDAAVTTWLHRIVVNACLDRLRRRKVRLADPLPDDLEDRSRQGQVTPIGSATTADAIVVDPADLAVDAERRAAVVAALAKLPLDQRAALVLVDMEGYSVEETARILDCAPGTVKSRCSRGRAKLLPLLVDLRADTDATPRAGNQPAPPRVPPAQDPGAARAPTQPPRSTDHDRPAATTGEEVTSSDA